MNDEDSPLWASDHFALVTDLVLTQQQVSSQNSEYEGQTIVISCMIIIYGSVRESEVINIYKLFIHHCINYLEKLVLYYYHTGGDVVMVTNQYG